jgi:uncharacterized protein YndB with AHSA1/START domain
MNMATTASAASSDRIEKQVSLKADRARVWRALTRAAEFGQWFRVKLEGEFRPGQRISGQITYPGYEHLRFDADVQQMEEPRYFSFRWYPYSDKSKYPEEFEAQTLVEFWLEDSGEGTLLKVSESGFDKLPPGERRDEAFRMNSGGWEAQMQNIQRHVDG